MDYQHVGLADGRSSVCQTAQVKVEPLHGNGNYLCAICLIFVAEKRIEFTNVYMGNERSWRRNTMWYVLRVRPIMEKLIK